MLDEKKKNVKKLIKYCDIFEFAENSKFAENWLKCYKEEENCKRCKNCFYSYLLDVIEFELLTSYKIEELQKILFIYSNQKIDKFKDRNFLNELLKI